MSHKFNVGDRIRVVVDVLSQYAFDGRIPGSPKGYIGTVFQPNDNKGSVGITLDGIVYSEPPIAGEIIHQWVDATDIEPLRYTAQEVFELVAKHAVFTLKGERATEEGSLKYCAYETHDGKQCFVGGLIPDVVVRRNLGGSSDNGRVMLALAKQGIGDEHREMLRDLQILHDAGVPGDKREDGYDANSKYYNLTPGRRLYQWKRALRRYAGRHGLIAPDYLGKESPKKPKAAAQA